MLSRVGGMRRKPLKFPFTRKGTHSPGIHCELVTELEMLPSGNVQDKQPHNELGEILNLVISEQDDVDKDPIIQSLRGLFLSSLFK